MLPEFKKRIDTLRQILVGAVPSPAGQIEQITYALIYKFMSDIDDKAASLPGGKRTYFTGEYERYGWHELMTPTLGAHERLALYREALSGIAKNPGLPVLFQEIYQNAFLPFNDPRVLTLFLKEVDNFEHSNSDDIGDAYEYLLQITGAQGDVGQFRTPRHIIKFIVEAVQPTKDDSVLDPAVGTAGFLIAAYNHVKNHHDGVDDITGLPAASEKHLTADEQDKMGSNYHGFDIDPTMVRTAKVNMYLHGFKTPDIKNHDSLSSEDFWNEKYDVILANPPFMSPKGGIKPHDKFGIKANRAEVLFVDYIASHLKPTGRAGIIVPEGVIFQSGSAYRDLRRNLVENSLYAVVSLPAGVFNPYAGVKTSVLLLDRELASKTDDVLFVRIENDGYSLNTRRRAVAGDQFPEALEVIESFRKGNDVNSELAHAVPRIKISENADYNLSGERYKLVDDHEHKEWEMVELGEVLDYEQPTKYIVESTDYDDAHDTPVLTAGKSFILGYTNEKDGIFQTEELPVIIFDDFTTATKLVDFPFKVKSSAMKILLAKQNVDVRYVYYVMQKLHFKPVEHKRFWISQYSKLKIPLPPIEIQREIVAELDGYQRIIDAAQAIVKTYKPIIKISPEWPLKRLSEVTERVTKGTTPTTVGFKYQEEGINFIKVESITPSGDFIEKKFAHIDNTCHEAFKRSQLKVGDVLFSIAGALGRVAVVDESILPANTNQALSIITPKDEVNSRYLSHVLRSNLIANSLDGLKTGVAQSNLSLAQVSNFSIPVPSDSEQKLIITELEAEQKLIDANKKLIETFQAKIKSKIAEVWGS